MSTVAISGLGSPGYGGPRLFSVNEYHQMITTGIIREGESVELIEGVVVRKMAKNPPHETALQATRKRIERLIGTGWTVRPQMAVTLSTSEPEPDVCVACGDDANYATRHPGPADIGLVVEVSDTTLASDRATKGPIYGRDRVVEYWIVNIPDRQIEVYTMPSGQVSVPGYANCQIYTLGSMVPLVLGGVTLGQIPVSDLLC